MQPNLPFRITPIVALSAPRAQSSVKKRHETGCICLAVPFLQLYKQQLMVELPVYYVPNLPPATFN